MPQLSKVSEPSKLIRVCLSQWLFWRESEIFLESETLYPSDTVIQEKTLTVFDL